MQRKVEIMLGDTSVLALQARMQRHIEVVDTIVQFYCHGKLTTRGRAFSASRTSLFCSGEVIEDLLNKLEEDFPREANTLVSMARECPHLRAQRRDSLLPPPSSPRSTMTIHFGSGFFSSSSTGFTLLILPAFCWNAWFRLRRSM